MSSGIASPISKNFIKASAHLLKPLAKIITTKGWRVADGAIGANLFACDVGGMISGEC